MQYLDNSVVLLLYVSKTAATTLSNVAFDPDSNPDSIACRFSGCVPEVMTADTTTAVNGSSNKPKEEAGAGVAADGDAVSNGPGEEEEFGCGCSEADPPPF